METPAVHPLSFFFLLFSFFGAFGLTRNFRSPAQPLSSRASKGRRVAGLSEVATRGAVGQVRRRLGCAEGREASSREMRSSPQIGPAAPPLHPGAGPIQTSRDPARARPYARDVSLCAHTGGLGDARANSQHSSHSLPIAPPSHPNPSHSTASRAISRAHGGTPAAMHPTCGKCKSPHLMYLNTADGHAS